MSGLRERRAGINKTRTDHGSGETSKLQARSSFEPAKEVNVPASRDRVIVNL